MIRISSVGKRYGTLTALDGVSLELAPGECLGLLGPNGAGKTTLMSITAGLRDADSGFVEVAGMRMSTAAAGPRRQLGLVPQAIALYPELTAEQNLRVFGELSGINGRELRERIGDALAAVGLSERSRDQVRTFSGGMQRRLNLVAALLHKPAFLLCDEPTVGVDPHSRNAIFELLESERKRGMGIIYSTHYMEEAERLCSRIAIIDHGLILAEGRLDDLLAKLPGSDEIRFPCDERTQALIKAVQDKGLLQTQGNEHRFIPDISFSLSSFFAQTEALGLPSRLFTMKPPSLENVFLSLTGRSLRE